jgi:hypothetical protein
MKERRATQRYDLSLPVTVRPLSPKESTCRTGKTRDISTGGLYFIINSSPDAGAELDLKLTLPSEVTGGAEVFIVATGKVVRVDKRTGVEGQPVGVAAVFRMREMVRNEAAAT